MTPLRLNNPMPSIADIAAHLGGEVRGNADVFISGVGSLREAGERQLAFYESEVHRRALQQCRAGAILISAAHADSADIINNTRWVVADSPRLYFARAAQWLQNVQKQSAGIAPTATVAADATIGANVRIESAAFIAAGASIGANCIIGAGAVVGEDVCIGEDTILMARATLYARTIVGCHCLIHSGAVIGADGFGFVCDADGRQIKIPQLGRTRLGDWVEVGANSAIDCGALDETVIGNGVKIDNLVQIGHNVQIGDNSVVCGCAGIAGGVHIGAGCMIGGGAGIAGHLSIGDGARIAARSQVTRTVAAGATVSSVLPAIPIEQWRRFVGGLRRLSKKAS